MINGAGKVRSISLGKLGGPEVGELVPRGEFYRKIPSSRLVCALPCFPSVWHLYDANPLRLQEARFARINCDGEVVHQNMGFEDVTGRLSWTSAQLHIAFHEMAGGHPSWQQA